MQKKSLAVNIFESNKIGVEFLITDAQTALTLLDMAETTAIPEDRSRRIGEALHAYQSILFLRARLSPTEEQARVLHLKLETLRTRLKSI